MDNIVDDSPMYVNNADFFNRTNVDNAVPFSDVLSAFVLLPFSSVIPAKANFMLTWISFLENKMEITLTNTKSIGGNIR